MQIPQGSTSSSSSSQAQAQQDEILRGSDDLRNFAYLDSRGLYEAMNALASEFPDLVTLKNAQEEFDLDAAGTDDDCRFDRKTNPVSPGCKNWYLTIEDKISHPPGSSTAKNLPEVFLSGSVHGNERVGPTAVVETATLLLDSAACEAIPRGLPPSSIETTFTQTTHNNDNTTSEQLIAASEWSKQLQIAHRCREDLERKGITGRYRKWLARLVTTRRIVILPTANALGYFRNTREENGIDPNRDFPYDQKDSKCMQTIAARTINELYRTHIFQLSLTFHAGMKAIGYEWGAPSYRKYLSPDDVAQAQIAEGYSRYAGTYASYNSVGGSKKNYYPFGSMNELVYPVNGGMEDWAYAASWDLEHTYPCKPTTFGGYPEEKTTYNNATLRTFNMLIETSDNKAPFKNELGSTLDIFNPHSTGNGHISRNVRLSLMEIDIVEPYLSIKSIGNIYIQDDIVPSSNRTSRNCMNTKAVVIPKIENEDDTILQWSVGGSFQVSETGILYAKWDDLPLSYDGSSQPIKEELEELDGIMKKIRHSNPDPETYWSTIGNVASNISEIFMGPVFSLPINQIIDEYDIGDQIAVLSYAIVDQSWRDSPSSRRSDMDYSPEIPPQSHLVNVRTNPEWYFESTGKVIQGRKIWFSSPLTLVIREPGTIMAQTERLTFNLHVEKTDIFVPVHDNLSENKTENSHLGLSFSQLVLYALSISLTIFGSYLLISKCVNRYVHRKEVEYEESPQDEEEDKSHSDDDGDQELSKFSIDESEC